MNKLTDPLRLPLYYPHMNTVSKNAARWRYRLLLLTFWAIPLHAQPFQITSGLFNQSLTEDLGLSLATGTTTHTVYKPIASSDKYGNGVVLIGFKGALYCQWQSSAIHEDSTDTWVAYSKSSDGITWSAPAVLSAKRSDGITTSGGWWVHGDTLIAYINFWPAGLSPKGGEALYTSSTDGKTWSALQPVRMKDGTAMKGVMEQDPHFLANGRIVGAAHFQSGLIVSPIYTDDSSGVRGWTKAKYTNMGLLTNSSREIEPSLYQKKNGNVVMVFRDQSTSTYVKVASQSTDNGASWSTVVATDYPDSRAKQSAGNLPDGTAYMVSNPVSNKTRVPLAIGLSTDGETFTKAYVLRQGGSDLQTKVYEGKAKTVGYSYPKSTVWNGNLYVGYATNKEDIEVTRIPLQSIALNDTCAGTQVCVVPEPEPDPEEPPIQILRLVVRQTPWVNPRNFDLLGRRDF